MELMELDCWAGFEECKLRQLRCPGAAHGGGEQSFLTEFPGSKQAAGVAFVEHEDAVAHAHEFGEFAADEDDGFAFRGELIDELVNLALGPHVYAAGGFIQKQQVRGGLQGFADDGFLLIAAAESAGGVVESRGFDAQGLKQRAPGSMLGGTVNEPAFHKLPQRGEREIPPDALLKVNAGALPSP
jgi:hypothetical protein